MPASDSTPFNTSSDMAHNPVDAATPGAKAGQPSGGGGGGGMQWVEQGADRVVAVLPNRLLVVAQRLDAGPVVSVQYRVKTGSMYENQWMGCGVSHFLEHLVAGGSTTTQSEKQSNDRLADIGGQTNAFTGLDGVGYYINAASNHADEAIDLVTDWVKNNRVADEEFQRERDVIQREFEMGAGEPARIQWHLTQQARFGKHPAKHPIIGYLDAFKAVTRDELFAFYQAMYVPNNMLCAVVGDIDPQAVVERLAKHWQDRPAVDLPNVALPNEPTMHQAETGEHAIAARADIPHPRVRLGWPTVQGGHEDEAALDALAAILGQGEASRLVETIRDQQRLVVGVQAYHLSFSFEAGWMGIDHQAAPLQASEADGDKDADPNANKDADALAQQEAEQLAAIEQAILQEVDRLVAGGVTEDELTRVKKQILSGVVQSDQSVQQVAARLCRTVLDFADPDHLHRYNQQIQALTVADIAAVAQRYLVGAPSMRVHLLPLREGIDHPWQPPTTPPPPEAPEEASEETACSSGANAGEALQNNAVDALAESDNVHVATKLAQWQPMSRQARGVDAHDAVSTQLANGLLVHIEPSRRLPAVAMHLYQLGGLLADAPGQEGSEHALAVMRLRGAAGRSAAQWAQAMESIGADIDTTAGRSTSGLTGNCLAADWSTVLGWMGELWTQPTLAESEWSVMQTRLLAAIDNQQASWRGALSNLHRPAFFKEHPWAQSTLGRRDAMAALDATGLAALQQRRLAADAPTVLSVVGDVDPDAVLKQIEKTFGSLGSLGSLGPFGAVAPALADLPQPSVPTAGWCSQVTAKQTTAVHVGLGPGVARGHAAHPCLAVLATLCSNFPSGYLDQALRGSGPGLVYAVGASIGTGAVAGSMDIVFNTDVAQLPEAIGRTQQVIDKLKQGDIAEQALAQAKAKLLTGHFMGQQTLDARAANQGLTCLYGAEAVSGQAFLDAVDGLTVADVQAVAQTHLAEAVWSIIAPQALDEAAISAATGVQPL